MTTLIIALYSIVSLLLYVGLLLNITSLNLIRSNLSLKQRKNVDNHILFLKEIKKLSIIWPVVIYKILKAKNEKQ